MNNNYFFDKKHDKILAISLSITLISILIMLICCNDKIHNAFFGNSDRFSWNLNNTQIDESQSSNVEIESEEHIVIYN